MVVSERGKSDSKITFSQTDLDKFATKDIDPQAIIKVTPADHLTGTPIKLESGDFVYLTNAALSGPGPSKASVNKYVFVPRFALEKAKRLNDAEYLVKNPDAPAYSFRLTAEQLKEEGIMQKKVPSRTPSIK